MGYYMDQHCIHLAVLGPLANNCQLQSEREYRMSHGEPSLGLQLEHRI
jgi:hypothetical protein